MLSFRLWATPSHNPPRVNPRHLFGQSPLLYSLQISEPFFHIIRRVFSCSGFTTVCQCRSYYSFIYQYFCISGDDIASQNGSQGFYTTTFSFHHSGMHLFPFCISISHNQYHIFPSSFWKISRVANLPWALTIFKLLLMIATSSIIGYNPLPSLSNSIS